MWNAFPPSDRYTSLRNALQTVMGNVAYAGLMVGMNFFPVFELPDPDQCDVGLYNPLQVSTGSLPAHSATLLAAIDAQSVWSESPTYPALEGTLAYLVAQRTADPNNPRSVVLITDEPPLLCGSGISPLLDLVSNALGSGVRTFVVTLDPAYKTAFDAVAQEGGTTVAWSPTSQAQLEADLAAIFASAMGP